VPHVSRSGSTLFSYRVLHAFITIIQREPCSSTKHCIRNLTIAELNDTQRAFLASLPTFDPTSTSVHPASCHCGTIQYTITFSPPLSAQKVGSCNCTICTKNGYLFLYPRRQDVTVHKGEESLKSYQFGKKQLLHRFCGECGSSVWHDPRLWMLGDGVPDLLGVNVSHPGQKCGERVIGAAADGIRCG
jgi:hypothetical protein